MTEFLDQHLFSLGATSVTVGMILAALGVAIASLVAAQVVKRLTIRHFERHSADDRVAGGTLAKLMAALVLLVGLDIVLHIFGFRLASILAAGGVFALGAGFAVKNTVENYFSGIILRLDRTIRQGDVVELDGGLMEIERIGLRSTVGKTGDGVEILVPNSTLADATVMNLTREDRLVRVTVRVGVALDSDRQAVQEALERVLADQAGEPAKQEARVVLDELTSGAIVYSVSIWIDDVTHLKLAKSELNDAIWRELEAAGVALA